MSNSGVPNAPGLKQISSAVQFRGLVNQSKDIQRAKRTLCTQISSGEAWKAKHTTYLFNGMRPVDALPGMSVML